MLYKTKDIDQIKEVQCQLKTGEWVPFRPLNFEYDSWKQRLKWAWGVLTGKYDVLDWGPEQRR